MPLRTYQDAVCIVTGGASGIGKALAKALVARGARVVIADRQDDVIHQVARELGPSERVAAAVVDVRDAAAVERLVAGAFAEHGRLDYLFNNAGTGVGGEAKDYTLDDWLYVLDVNLNGVVYGVHAAYPRMIAQGFGHIVNTASAAGLVPTAFTASYAASKHAVVGLTRTLRVEAREHGVRASVICPGVIRTPLLENAGRYGRVKLAVPVATQLEAWQALRPMNADVFAGRVLDDVARDAPVIVHPRSWRLAVWLDRLFPSLYEAVGYRVYLKTRDKFAAAARPAVKS